MNFGLAGEAFGWGRDGERGAGVVSDSEGERVLVEWHRGAERGENYGGFDRLALGGWKELEGEVFLCLQTRG